MCNVTIGKVNDIKGFFETYREMRIANFISLFGDVPENDVQALDYCLSDIYGSRCLQGRFSDIYNNRSADDCMARIVTIADKLYYENWINTKHAIEKASLTDLDKPLTSEKTGENTTKNKVNAFDSETASDSDNSTHNYSETTRYSNGKTVTQNAKTQIDFTRNNDFLEIIMNDILSVCCLSVYDDSYHPYRVSGGGETDPELEGRVTQCETDIRGIKKLIPATATEQNKLATIADVQSGYDDTELRGKIEGNTEDIQGIYNSLIDYATKTELQAVENQIPDVSNLATKTELQDVGNQIPDVSNLATKTELHDVENQIPDVSNLVTKTELQDVGNQIDEQTLVVGETGTKTFGTFKLFLGIAKFLASSAKKIIKGGLEVDSLTVNGSEVAKKSMLPINSDKHPWGSNMGEITLNGLKDFYMKSMFNWSSIEFVCNITELKEWGVCRILRLNKEWGSISFNTVGKRYLMDLINEQWQPITRTLDVDFVNETKSFQVGTINPNGTLQGTLDLTKNGYYPVSATMGSNHYTEVMIGSNIISGNQITYGLYNVTGTPMDMTVLVNVLYKKN